MGIKVGSGTPTQAQSENDGSAYITGHLEVDGTIHADGGIEGISQDHNDLENIGTTTHAQIDDFIASENQPNGWVSLNDDGELDARVILQHDTAANINAIVLEQGEIATTTDTLDLRVGDGVTAGGISLRLNSTSCVIVTANGSAAANGTALTAAYTAAKLLTPNGAALSNTNRATVLVGPGVYTGAVIPHDTNYVDMISMAGSRSTFIPGGTQSAANIRLIGFTITTQLQLNLTNFTSTPECYHEDLDFLGVDTTTVIMVITGSGSLNGTFRNCRTSSLSTGLYGGLTNMTTQSTILFEDCVAGLKGLCGATGASTGGTMSGIMRRCTVNAASWNVKVAGLMDNCVLNGCSINRLVEGASIYRTRIVPASGTCIANNSVSVNIKAGFNTLKTFSAATPWGSGVTNLLGTPYNIEDDDVS